MTAKNDDSIMTVDMSDEHAIIVNYKNGMIFKMGNWNDVEYKLDLAQKVMDDESVKGKKGYLMMVGTKQCSFRPNGELAEETAVPIETDENGVPINTTTTTTTAVPDYTPQDDGQDYGDGGEGWYGDDFGYDGYENEEIYEQQ